MPRRSAGMLLYRRRGAGIEVLLVHPGGPFWAKKDTGAWSIPKGEYEDGEDPFTAAMRELTEETGWTAHAPFLALGTIKQPSGKLVTAWAAAGDGDPATIRSNTFTMEWPPRSGTMREFPEVDRAAWYGVEEAREKLVAGQRGFVDALVQQIEMG